MERRGKKNKEERMNNKTENKDKFGRRKRKKTEERKEE